MTESEFSKILQENTNKKRKYEEPILPPCRVCGSKSTGYHYGVISCGACKAFFRRSIQMKTSYRCKGNDQCLIRPDQSVPCSHCRFQKCLELGMSKDGIRMGRYTIQRKSAVIKEVKTLEDGAKRKMEEMVRRQREREEELQALVDATTDADTKYPLASPEIVSHTPIKQRKYIETKRIRESIYGSLKPVPHTMYEHLYYSFGLELDDRRKRIQLCLDNCEQEIIANINFAKALPGFSSLEIDDQLRLLKDTMWEWMCFSMISMIDTKEELITCPSCGYTLTVEEASVFYGDACDVSFFQCAKMLKPLNLTAEELAVTKAICVFNPDGGLWPPKDRKKVGEIQQKYIDALQFVFSKNKKDCAIKIGRITSCMTSLKSLEHRYSKNSRNWTNMFPGVTCSDLVSEWLGPQDPSTCPDLSVTRELLLGDEWRENDSIPEQNFSSLCDEDKEITLTPL